MSSVAYGQTLLFSENFESNTLADSINHVGTGTWGKSSILFSEGAMSDSLRIPNPGDSVAVTTFSFSTTGSSFVMLYFDHICKIEFFDAGEIFVSNSNGANWTKLTGAQYLGPGLFTSAMGDKFTSTTYLDWLPGTTSTPLNSWWKSEIFDISSLVGNAPQVLVRFVLRDNNNGTQFENSGWFIDNIRVVGALSELKPPIITMVTPVLPDTVFTTGPHVINANITDSSGVDTAYIVYAANAGAPDTVPMTNVSGSLYTGTIPAYTFGTLICYRIVAIDGSVAHNPGYLPASGCKDLQILLGPSIVTIGTDTITNLNTGYPAPYGNWYWGARHQFLIPVSELIDRGMVPGQIISLGFDVVAIQGTPLQNFTIKMGHTTQTVLTSVFFQPMTTVYSVPTYTETTGWNTHTFQTPFTWNGKDNLVIETCFNNSSYTFNAVVRQTGTTYASSSFYFQDVAPVCSTMSGATTANQRPNIQLGIPPSKVPSDAGVSQIDSPVGIVPANSNININIHVKNYGLDTLKKATILYSLNGVTQPPYIWTGTLPHGVSSQLLTIGTVNVPPGVHVLKAWTSMPNDTVDFNPLNDTCKVNFYACSQILNGTYTVGGAGADFADLNSAFLGLYNCGIGGPVEFLIAPGTYSGQWEFTDIPGISPVNTVTFRSSTNNRNDVILIPAAGVTSNYVVRFNGARYIMFKNITIRSSNLSVGRIVEFMGNCEHITIDSCFLEAPVTTSSTSVPVYSSTSADYNITISNSTLKGGYYGVYYYTISTNRKVKFNLLNNNIIDFYFYGIYTFYTDSLNIEGNYLSNHSSSGVLYPAYIGYTTGWGSISKNRIVSTNTSTNYGLFIAYKQAASTDPLVVSNNFISQSGNPTGTIYSIYVVGSNYVDFYFNSVNVAGGSATTGRPFFLSSGAGINIVNNIFSNTNGGYAYYVSTPSAVLNSDYNNFFTSGPYLAFWNTNQTNLPALKLVTGMETNSHSMNPPFAGIHDLALTNTLLSARATTLAAVPDDFFSNPRASFPTIGAHEIPLIGKDAGVISFITPTSQTIVAEAATIPVTVNIQNFGTDTLTGLDVVYSVNGSTPVTTTFTGQLLPFQIAPVILPSFTSPAGNVDISARTVLPNDSNIFNDSVTITYFATPFTDGMLTRILPVNEGCGIGLNTIRIRIRNAGATQITGNIDVSYRLKGDTAIVTETTSGPIAINDSILFIFSTLADFSTPVDSTFIVEAWVKVPGDNIYNNDTATLEVLSLRIPSPPIVSDTTIPYAGFVTLFAQSLDSVYWYDSDSASAELIKGAYYTTPVLFDTTIYWVEAVSAFGHPESLFLGPHVSDYATTHTGGFHFTAPVDMVITELRVPATVVASPQYIQVVKFDGYPQGFPAVNTFSTLAYLANAPYGIFHKVNIPVSAGDEIGIIGAVNSAGTTMNNSFGQSQVPSSIGGIPVVLTRIEYQNSLVSGPAPSGAISLQASAGIVRVEMNFMLGAGGCTGIRVPLSVNMDDIPPYDIGISELQVKQGCALHNEPVTIKVYNQGTDTLKGGATASFRVNNNPWVIAETIPDTITPGKGIFYTFNSHADLTAPLTSDTIFKIKARVDIPGDPYKVNDTIVQDSVFSLMTPATPVVVSPVNISYNSFAALSATGMGSVYWYPSQFSTVHLDTGNTFITPVLWDTTTYWAGTKIVSELTGTAESGNGTITNLNTAYPSPYGNRYRGSRHQFLIPAAELVAAGLIPGQITSLGFNVAQAQGTPLQNFTIKIGHTSLTSMPSTFVGNLTTVYSVPWYTDINGWNNHMFQSPFVWNGTGNIIIETCFNNNTQTYNASVYQSATAYYATLYYSGDISTVCSTGSGTTIPQRPNIRLNFKNYIESCESTRVPIQINTSTPPLVDAGIEEMVNPYINAASNVSHPIQVKLKNFGSDTLIATNIVWSINNVVQDTVSWTGTLPWGVSQVITIDTMVFPGGYYCIRVWTLLPNAVPDTVPLNDSASHCFNACHSGIYTIGPAATGAWHYNTFNQALAALQSDGICGHVIFEVQPGIYSEQLTIPEIPGVGQNQTVTFRGSTGDSTLVTLQYTTAGVADYWTLRLNGADWFRFEKMTIKGLGSSFARAVEFIAGAHNNIISNCLIEVPVGTSSQLVPVYSPSTSNDNYNKLLNNCIKNGYYGIQWNGMSTTNLQKGNIFEGNLIEGFYYYGAYLYSQDSLVFNNNTVRNLTGFADGYGIYAAYCQNDIRILKNRVELAPAGTLYGGIYMYYCSGTTARRGLIANNFVSVIGTNISAVQYAIRLYYSNQQDLMFNSVNVSSGAGTSRAIDIYYGTGNNIQSNHGRITSGGYAFYVTSGTAVNISNHNNWWSSAGNFAFWEGNCPTLALLQLYSNKEGNSHNLNVPFVSDTDLHIMSSNLTARAQYSARVTDDIDDEPRSALPTIGADEVPLIPKDAAVTAILSPGTNTSEGQVYPVQVIVTNYGTDTIYPNILTIQYTVNAGTPVSVVYTGAPIPSLGSATVSLPSMTSPAGSSVICAITVLPGDSNLFNDEFCKSFFATPVNDAMVSRIVGLRDGCNIGTDTISIWVRNLGVNPINSPVSSTVTVSYRVKPTAPVVTQAFTPVLMPNDSVMFHFSTLADLSVTTVDDTFRVKVWIDLQGDNVKYNDTAHSEVISLHIPLPPLVSDTTIPYATPVTLHAQSSDSVQWFAQDTATIELFKGAYFTTPALFSGTTYWVQAASGYFASSGPYFPGVNIAPQATATATICNSGPCSALNDLNSGACGMQQMWVSTTTPPSIVPHVEWIDFEWPADVSVDGMRIHNGQSNTRLLTGATLYKWEAGNWVSFHTFGNLPMQCNNTVPFPLVTTKKLRITSFQMTGTGQQSNPNFREIEIFEALASGCIGVRAPLNVTVLNPVPCNVGVSAILYPVSAINMTSQETVTVKVDNYGTVSQSNIPVSFQIDNQPAVNETITATVGSNSSINFTFGTKADLSISGNTYQLRVWTGLSCDSIDQNDTSSKYVTNLLPVYCNSTATSALFQEITNITIDTLFSNTSPAIGAMYTNYSNTVLPPTLLPGITYPMSITSGFAPGASTQYSSWVKVWIDLNRDGIFDQMTEEVFSQATISNTTVAANIQIPFTAMHGITMMRVVLDRTMVPVDVTPCGIYDFGETEDYLITIAPQAPCDAGVIKIISPPSISQAGVSHTVWVKFMNFGSDPIAPGALSIAYRLNSGTPVVVAYPSGLPPGGTDSIQMPGFILPMGNNTLCVYTILACDSIMLNDEICMGVYGRYFAGLPFFDNFETGNNWYKPAASQNWQYGIPSANTINSAYSGTKALVTKLAGDYTNNADEYIYTPAFSFLGLGATDTITLSFYHWCDMVSPGDFGRVQYSTNGGQSWVTLGNVGDLSGTNWYNIFLAGQSYFSHLNSGWMYSAYKLDPNAVNGKSEVQFRFHFKSGPSGTANGWAIDDFRLSLPVVPNDVGATAIQMPLNDTTVGSMVNVSIEITNFGTSSQSLIPVELRMNGSLVSAESWTGMIFSNDTVKYTFTLPVIIPSTPYSLCVRTVLPNDAFSINDQTCRNFNSIPANIDVGIAHILSPLPDNTGRICFYEAASHPWYAFPVTVSLKNYGVNNQTSIPISYTFFNGGQVNNQTWTGTLAYGDSVVVLLNILFKPNLGAQKLCVETELTGDSVFANNKACRTYTGVTCIGIEDGDDFVFTLKQNIPNPAKGVTLIGYSVPQGGIVNFGLVNMVGQVMQTESYTVETGSHQIELDVTTLAAGVYYYFVEYEGRRLTRKMVVGR